MADYTPYTLGGCQQLFLLFFKIPKNLLPNPPVKQANKTVLTKTVAKSSTIKINILDIVIT